MGDELGDELERALVGTGIALARDDELLSADGPTGLDLFVSEEGVRFAAATEPRTTAQQEVGSGGPDDFLDGHSERKEERRRLVFEDLPGNRLHEAIAVIDDKLSPKRGLRRLDPDGGRPVVAERLEGSALLLVHGTFSHTDSIVERLGADPAFFAAMRERYDHIVTYDYPTLGQEAIASAMGLNRLARAFLPDEVGVISHSQGGLVTRYWLELLDPGRLPMTRSVFVAGTLEGTSLAAPWALRSALDWLGQVSWALRKGGELATVGGLPFFGGIALLFGALEKTVKFLSNAPVADVGAALVPGFAGMSRVSTNAPLAELRAQLESVPEGYFAATADFEPGALGLKFWRHWQTRLADGVVDRIFNRPNDLVVDTAAQTQLAKGKSIPKTPERTLAFEPGQGVHHTNYFDQERVRRFLIDTLGKD